MGLQEEYQKWAILRNIYSAPRGPRGRHHGRSCASTTCTYGIVLIPTGSQPPSCPRSSHSNNEIKFYLKREFSRCTCTRTDQFEGFVLMRFSSISISSRRICDKHYPLPSTCFLVFGAFPPGVNSSACTSTEISSRENLCTSNREANRSLSVFLAWRT